MSDRATIDALAAVFAARESDVRAFLSEPERFTRLRHESGLLAVRYPDPAERPSLWEWTVGVKDIFHADGFVTRAGTDFLTLNGPQAPAVTRLLDAGALVAGKTVTTEFAYFAPGPTRNPHALDHTPGGSSSGSAAAVAAGLCRIALGTQTIGSVIRPAAFCGVAGFKPTYDRIPRAGVIPLAPSVDTVGCFAADVADLRVTARVLVGEDWRMIKLAADLPVLGVPLGPYLEHADPTGTAHFRRVIGHFAAAGYEVRYAEVMPDFEYVADRHRALVAGEAARVHAGWFAEYGAHYHAKTAALIQQGQGIDDVALAVAGAGRAQLREDLHAAMDAHGIDLWIAPPAPGPAPRGLASTGDPIMNLPWTHAGLPALALPAGRSAEGLPLGVQVVGRWGQDELLLGWAIALERALASFDTAA